jgi:hypothetical protein
MKSVPHQIIPYIDRIEYANYTLHSIFYKGELFLLNKRVYICICIWNESDEGFMSSYCYGSIWYNMI